LAHANATGCANKHSDVPLASASDAMSLNVKTATGELGKVPLKKIGDCKVTLQSTSEILLFQRAM